MKRGRGYLLQRIAGTDYLLPYGQLIADHRRGISLNSTGVYVWNLLENEMPRAELQEQYLNHFLDEPEQKDALIEDLNQFLNLLIAHRIIEDDAKPQTHYGEPCACLSIGGLALDLYGPKELAEVSGLQEFCTDISGGTDTDISVILGISGLPADGTVLVNNPELTVYDRDDEILLFFPTFEQISEVRLLKDGTSAFFYCKPPITEEFGTQFFHALRHVYLYLAELRGMYAIHSASILYRGQAWLFSGVSGTGKSTHTNLWQRLYGAEILNGDLNLLSFEGGRPVIRGIPWCGTSGIFSKDTLPLGGIILLKQAPTDSIVELPPDKKALLIMQRFISPMWTAKQLEESVKFAERLSQKISVCRLQCTKNNSAAEVMKKWVDGKSTI